MNKNFCDETVNKTVSEIQKLITEIRDEASGNLHIQSSEVKGLVQSIAGNLQRVGSEGRADDENTMVNKLNKVEAELKTLGPFSVQYLASVKSTNYMASRSAGYSFE